MNVWPSSGADRIRAFAVADCHRSRRVQRRPAQEVFTRHLTLPGFLMRAVRSMSESGIPACTAHVWPARGTHRASRNANMTRRYRIRSRGFSGSLDTRQPVTAHETYASSMARRMRFRRRYVKERSARWTFDAARRVPRSWTGLHSSAPSQGDRLPQRSARSVGKGGSCVFRDSRKGVVA